MARRLKIWVDTDIASIKSFSFSVKRESKNVSVKIVLFELKKPVSPSEARDLADLIRVYITQYLKPENNEIIAISGRGPIWLYSMIQHYLHGSVSNLAIVDPKVGAVVVTVHSWDIPYQEGDVIEIPEEVKAELSRPPA